MQAPNTVLYQKRLCSLALPVETKIRKHGDYNNTIYVHIGYRDMFTLSNGNIYGQALGSITSTETQRLEDKNRKRAKIRSEYQHNIELGNKEKGR